jgi:O-antigen/teichoic acid export membrane protein
MFSLKKILKASSVYTFLGFLPTASRIILLPIFLIFLDPTEFALIGLNTLVASILPLLMTFGLESAFSRFYFDYKRKPELLKSYLSTILIFVFLNSILIGGIFLVFGNNLFEFVFKSKEFSFFPFGITAIIAAIFSSVGSVITNYFRNKQDLKSFAAFSLSLFLFSTLFETIAIMALHYKANGVITAKLIPTGIITLFFVIRQLKQNGIYFEFRFLKQSLKYAFPLIPYTGFGLVFLYFDRIFIENKLDLVSLAVYNVAMSIAHITDAFMFAIQVATYPIIYELLKKDAKANLDQVSQTYRFIGVVVIVIITGIIAVSPIGILGFLKPQYIPAIQIIPIILISYAFRYLYIVYVEPLFFFKKTKYLPWLTISGGCVSIMGNILLIPYFGIVGASFTSVIAKLAQFIPTYYLYLKVNTIRFSLSYIYILIVVVFGISLLIFLSFDFLMLHKTMLYLISMLPILFVVIFIYLKFLKFTQYKIFLPTASDIKQIF